MEMNEMAKNNDFESIKPLLDELYEKYINLDDGTEYGAICAEEIVAYGLPDIFAQANASKALRDILWIITDPEGFEKATNEVGKN